MVTVSDNNSEKKTNVSRTLKSYAINVLTTIEKPTHLCNLLRVNTNVLDKWLSAFDKCTSPAAEG